jgi:hypothetical protein
LYGVIIQLIIEYTLSPNKYSGVPFPHPLLGSNNAWYCVCGHKPDLLKTLESFMLLGKLM